MFRKEFAQGNNRFLNSRKWFPRRDALQDHTECMLSWRDCPCGKTLPGFSPRCVLGRPSAVYLSNALCLVHELHWDTHIFKKQFKRKCDGGVGWGGGKAWIALKLGTLDWLIIIFFWWWHDSEFNKYTDGMWLFIWHHVKHSWLSLLLYV